MTTLARRPLFRTFDGIIRRLASATFAALGAAAAVAVAPGCGPRAPAVGALAYERRGDEIVVAGQYFHTGAPVVLWTDPGGYDAYRVERRFGPWERASWEAMQKEKTGPGSPNRFNLRKNITPEQTERFRGGGWDLASLQQVVDLFVIHYDVCGTSRTCFRVLHDQRGLSVHFMLDIDGTIYQTLDAKERAWHAGTSNDRSVGIEIANIGAYPEPDHAMLRRWYAKDSAGRTTITIPPDQGDGGLRTPGFTGAPRFSEPIQGQVHGQTLHQYDLTPQQYDSLIRLTAALHRALPRIALDYPRGPDGRVLAERLPDPQLAAFSGLVGHFHVERQKIDPGPAFDWEHVVREAAKLVGPSPSASGGASGEVD